MSFDRHREIFNQLLSDFDYKAKEVSEWTGLHVSRISRFRTGKVDLEAGELFEMLANMPQGFQTRFWIEFRGQKLPDINDVIEQANFEQLVYGLTVIARRISAKTSNSTNSKLEKALL
jgi:hypothetical protein